MSHGLVSISHAEELFACTSLHEQIPYFNAPIFLENKTQIGKVEEILGPINNVVSETSILPVF